MMPRTTNVTIAAATLLLLVACLPFHDLIPAGSGQGYDGSRYAGWVRDLSFGSLVDSAKDHWRPEPSSHLELDPYYAHRILPSLTLHYVLTGLRLDTGLEVNLLRAFTALDILLLTIAMMCWLKAADELAIDSTGKWLGFLALAVSYGNLKMPLYYPILTDSAAFAVGSACLLFYLQRRQTALWLCCLAGAFIWPTITYFGFFLIAFPRATSPEDEPGPRGLSTVLALGGALACALIIEMVFSSGYVKSDTPIRPIAALFHASVAVAALYVFLGLRPLFDSKGFWQSLKPWRLMRSPGVFAGCLLLVVTEFVARLIGPVPADVDARVFLSDTFWTAAMQPAIFFLAHVLYFGPVLLFCLFLWPRMGKRVRAEGAGLVLYFSAMVVLSLGSESRRLINVLPFAVLFLVSAMHGVAMTRRRWAFLAGVTVICSKIWLPMDRTLSVPFAGELNWRTLYISSRGPWMNDATYSLQMVLVLLLLPAFYIWCYSAELHSAEKQIRRGDALAPRASASADVAMT